MLMVETAMSTVLISVSGSGISAILFLKQPLQADKLIMETIRKPYDNNVCFMAQCDCSDTQLHTLLCSLFYTTSAVSLQIISLLISRNRPENANGERKTTVKKQLKLGYIGW
jgi:hypothetical protein